MNKFVVLSCVDLDEKKESEYEGPVVILTNVSDPTFVLFFPITEQNASVILSVLENEKEYDADTSILGIYATMLASWKASEIFLSGIIIDTIYNDKVNKEIPLVRLVLSDRDGMIDSMVRVNFIHAVLLASMEKVEIIISDRLLDIMLPDTEDASDRINSRDLNARDLHANDFPEDKNIINIAKQIMEGRIKEDPDNKNKK